MSRKKETLFRIAVRARARGRALVISAQWQHNMSQLSPI